MTAVAFNNVSIIDGTGAKARHGFVRIVGERIAEVGQGDAGACDIVVDGDGLVLAPGFIDLHSHHDRSLFRLSHAPGVISQGITSIIVGADGFSYLPLSNYFDTLRAQPVTVNVGSFTGHNTLRDQAMPEGDRRRVATDAEGARMADLLRADMRAGSLGLSTGLAYETGVFSDSEEIISLAHAASEEGGRYVSHIRNESALVSEAMDEAIEIGRAARIPVQISHIKIAVMDQWGTAPKLIEKFEAARREGIDVTADLYPYTSWQTTMRILFPNKDFSDPSGVAVNFATTVLPENLWIQRYAADPGIAGRSIAELAEARGCDCVKLYVDLMQRALAYEAENPDVPLPSESVIGVGMDERDITAFLTWPHTNICTDGVDGGHPRAYGAFTRVFDRYVRGRGALSLESAVHKMTGLAAHNLGLASRGTIRPGAFADLVLFDPATIGDAASMDAPTALSNGIRQVWVNGAQVYNDGAFTANRPGTALRREVSPRPIL